AQGTSACSFVRSRSSISVSIGAEPRRPRGPSGRKNSARSARPSSSTAAIAPRRTLFIERPPAKRLDRGPGFLGLNSSFLGCAGRPRGSSFPGHEGGLLHQLVQAREGLGAVHLQAAVALRLDDDDAAAGDAVVAAAQ